MSKLIPFPTPHRQTPNPRVADTLRTDHNQLVKLLAALPVPPAPTVYDTHCELGYLFHDQIAYLRALLDAISPVFERCADDAADHGGARAESFDLIRGAAEDFIAPISSAAEELSGTE